MQTPDIHDGVEQLRSELAEFHYSLFRLETLQHYSGSSEDDAFANQDHMLRPAKRATCHGSSPSTDRMPAPRKSRELHGYSTPRSSDIAEL